MAGHPLPFDPVAEAKRQWEARGWAAAAPGMAAVTSVMRAEQIFLARVDEVLRGFGLTFARFEALRLLTFTRSGELPLSKVGQRLQVHPASVTNTIDRLEGQGLVERVPHPTDGRTTLARVTRPGRRLVEQATTALNEQVFSRTGLSDPELAELVRLLGRLRRAAGDFAD